MGFERIETVTKDRVWAICI